MKIKTLLRIISTPSCWIRNYRTNKTVDLFIRNLVEHKDEVELLGFNDCNIYLKFRGKIFGLWRANKWYAYLSRISLITDIKYTYRYERQCEEKMPSREACFLFYETFGVLVEKSAKDKERKKTDFLEEVIKP